MKFIILTCILLTNTFVFAKQIDRYTILANVPTVSQNDPLESIISVKFAKNITTVDKAVKKILNPTGYKLVLNLSSEKIKKFKLPFVHKKLGPLSVKDAIRVLIGRSLDIQVDESTRSVTLTDDFSRPINSSSNNISIYIQEPIKENSLKKVIAVSIKKNNIVVALNKIAPAGWSVVVEDIKQKDKIISIVSDAYSREEIIKKIAKNINTTAYFYQELQTIVLRSNKKVIN